jgi:serine/threonine protein kinase
MSLSACDLKFETTFYNMDQLGEIKDSLSEDGDIVTFSKLERKKIILSPELRLIPLESRVYAIYHKTLSIFDEDGSLGAFANKKTLKNMVIYDPSKPFCPFSELEARLSHIHTIPLEHRVIAACWNYDPECPSTLKLALKIHELSKTFHVLFPQYCPKIYDLVSYHTTTKSAVLCLMEELPPSRINQLDRYEIHSFENFKDHVLVIYKFLKTLFDNKIAHGDLASSNFVMNKQGKIDALIDFDTACNDSLLPMMYFKAFIMDLKKAFAAMMYYQTESNVFDWDDSVSLDLSYDQAYLINQQVELLQFIYTNKITPLFDYLLCSDFLMLSKDMQESLRDLVDPEKIFFDFLS